MSKLKIQKISNGQFCTARQWYADVLESCKNGLINRNFLNLPDLTYRDPVRAAAALAEMEEKYPLISAAWRIVLLCGLGDPDTRYGRPLIHINVDMDRLMLHTVGSGTWEEIYEAVDAALRAHIDEQREIVRKHNLTEV